MTDSDARAARLAEIRARMQIQDPWWAMLGLELGDLLTVESIERLRGDTVWLLEQLAAAERSREEAQKPSSPLPDSVDVAVDSSPAVRALNAAALWTPAAMFELADALEREDSVCEGQWLRGIAKRLDEIGRALEASNADRIALNNLLAETAAHRTYYDKVGIREDWTPTAAAINALPPPLYRLIHDLETRDPAHDVRARIAAEDRNRQLEAKLAEVIAERDDVKSMVAHATDAHRRLTRWVVEPHISKVFSIQELIEKAEDLFLRAMRDCDEARQEREVFRARQTAAESERDALKAERDKLRAEPVVAREALERLRRDCQRCADAAIASDDPAADGMQAAWSSVVAWIDLLLISPVKSALKAQPSVSVEALKSLVGQWREPSEVTACEGCASDLDALIQQAVSGEGQ